MKLRELIERLEEIEWELVAGLGGEVEPEVVGAYQPSYPLSAEVLGAICLQEDEDDEPILKRGAPVVWIAFGGRPSDLSPYAPNAAIEQAR